MGLKIKLIELVRFLMGLFVKPLIILAYKLYYWNMNKLKPLPRTYNLLLLLPANKLARKIRNREVIICISDLLCKYSLCQMTICI
jgi:hypothetical protein